MGCRPCPGTYTASPILSPFTESFQVEIQLIFKSMQMCSLASVSPDQEPKVQVFCPRAQDRAGHPQLLTESPSPALSDLFAPQGLFICSAFSPHDLHLRSISSRPDTDHHLPQRRSGDRKGADSAHRNRLSTWTLSHTELSPALSLTTQGALFHSTAHERTHMANTPLD